MAKKIPAATKGSLSILILTAVSAVLLTACKGQDTFKRQSNPYENYESMLKDTRPYDAKVLQQEAEERQKALNKSCGLPFTMNIEGERAKMAIFKEGEEKSILIHVDSTLDSSQNWDVKVVEAPCQNCLSTVSKTSNSTILKFTWTPSEGAATKVDGNFLTLRYNWRPEARCASLPSTETIALIVNQNENAPAITFPGLRTESLKFGDSFKFQIQVIDPAAQKSGAAAPDVSFVTLTKKIDGIVAGRKAIDCGKTGRFIQTAENQSAVVFDCSFNTQLLNESDIKALSGSGKAVDAAFTLRAISKVSGQSSDASARVHVQFEKITATTAQAKVQGAQK